ncbi:hypothetical protein F5Y14DRAFT_402524 [Nemania sp. NC0429]|nr:hypothetical protein F5Y14DRAFT_402524 [Nemania sp. NC0429]
MNIPGYYYDPEKQRYFKIENNKTAPTDAAWSSGNVKRRKLRDADAATALRHATLAKGRIRRARVLHEPLTGGFFAREYGAARADMHAACFAEGLRNKGCIPMRLPGWPGQPITSMYVSGHDYRTGMCTVYAVPNETMLLAAYFPRDQNKRLDQRPLRANYLVFGASCCVERHIPQISDVQYHAPSNRMLITSRQPFDGAAPNSLWAFHPRIDDADEDPLRPLWRLPSYSPFTNLLRGRATTAHNSFEAHCVAPAPDSSSSLCMVGTSRGVVQCHPDAPSRDWLAPQSAPGRDLLDLFRDIFAIDYHPHQSDVVFRFGGRPGALFTADTRTPCTTWSHLRLPSTITRLRCLDGGNQVLVAGLENQLGVYDLRFARSSRGTGGDAGDKIDIDAGKRSRRKRSQHNHFNHNHNVSPRNSPKGGGGSIAIAQPVIRFERYRNAAHVDIGFAYDEATGIVAAAHDDVPGTVALYSVRTGSRLRVLDFASEGKAGSSSGDGSSSSAGTSRARDAERADLPVIRSLQFQTFPGDYTPTLFVGSGRRGRITAFSFGVDDLEDEA